MEKLIEEAIERGFVDGAYISWADNEFNLVHKVTGKLSYTAYDEVVDERGITVYRCGSWAYVLEPDVRLGSRERQQMWIAAFSKDTNNPLKYADDMLKEFDERFPEDGPTKN